MPHILRIDNDPNVSEQNHQDWTGSHSGLTGNRIEHIPDTLSGAGGGAAGAAAKAGTSIPSPFARLYLFDTAFRMVKNNQYPRELSLYHVLVSHGLDMLELLFQAGNSPDLSYRVWNRNERLEALRQKANPSASVRHAHQILAKALELDFRNELGTLQQFTFVYYKGALLGGTSPLTLVFTSPNWEQERQNKFIDPPKSTTGRLLFQNEYVPLQDRDAAFVTYLRRLYDQYKDYLPPKGGFTEFLYKAFFDNPVTLPVESNTTLASFEPIQIGGESNSTLQVLPGLTLYKVRENDVLDNIEENSDFVMQPTVQYYRQESRNGAPTGVRKPLALASRMDVAGRYVKNTNWNPQIVIMRSLLNNLSEGGLLAERYLPGIDNVRYPFVTTDDFLEDFLIQVPFKINNKRFFTGTIGDCEFLLPLKKEYFNFFRPEDLQRQFAFSAEHRGTDKIVTATLQIPIRNNRFVTFRKEYNLSKQEAMLEFRAGLAFFPFYRVTVPDLQPLNQYHVMLADSSDATTGFRPERSVRFYELAGIITDKPLNVVAPEARSPKVEAQPASYHYKVPQAFDLVEVRLERAGIPYRALVLPQFTVVDQKGYKNFTFAIDFGTSNTHIAYSDAAMGDVEPKTFTVTDLPTNLDRDELQMVTLNRPYEGYEATTMYDKYRLPASYGGLIALDALIRREFVPSIIGKEYGSPFTFPLRTTVYEKSGFMDSGNNLFNKVNLGFNIDLEQGSTGVNHYVTNLKWLFENQPSDTLNRPRVRAFFETLLLLIRNKVVLNQGNVQQTSIVWLAPSSMRPLTEDNLVQEWEQACRSVFGTTANFRAKPVPESLAPYFYLVKNEVKSFADTVNVDIGGGTADIMLFMKQQGRYLNTSFRFAGYDIWGGGLDDRGHPSHKKDNGFVKNYLKYRRNLNQARALEDNIFDTFLEKPELTAEDIVSLLFKYDPHFKFTQSIQDGKPALRIVLYLHYSAIVYHLVQLLESHQLSLPRYLTFTGRGSQYLHMLGSRSRLISYTKMLFKAYTKLPVPSDFEVILSPNPKETTANGAVLYENAGGEKAQYENRETTCYWGAEQEPKEPEGEAQAPKFDFEYRRTKVGEVSPQRDFHNSVLHNMQQFLEKTLLDRDIAYFLSEYNIQTPERYVEFLVGTDITRGGRLYDSYMLARMAFEQRPNDALSETYFFLPLKHALYELSKFIAES